MRYAILLFSVFFTLPTFCMAAVGFGTPTVSTSASFSHTVGSDVPILFVSVAAVQVTGADVTGVTYDGVALTEAAGGVIDERTQGMWYLVDPAPGTATVAISYSNSLLGQRNMAVDITGIDTSDPVGATYYGNATNDKSKSMTPEGVAGVFMSSVLNPTSFTADTVTVLSASGSAYLTWESAQGYVFSTSTAALVSWNMGSGNAPGHLIAELIEGSEEEEGEEGTTTPSTTNVYVDFSGLYIFLSAFLWFTVFTFMLRFMIFFIRR